MRLSDVLVAALSLYVACDNGSHQPIAVAIPSEAIAAPGEPSFYRGVTVFPQAVPPVDARLEGTRDAYSNGMVFPGSANAWDLGADLSLRTGGGRQFSGALELAIGSLPAGARDDATFSAAFADGSATFVLFPTDQTLEQLTLSTPSLGAADGLAAAAASDFLPPIDGAFSAFLNGGNQVVLQQLVELGGAVPPLVLSVRHAVLLDPGALAGFGAYYRIALLDLATGDPIEELFWTGVGVTGVTVPDWYPIVSSESLAVLSFELRSNAYGLLELDDVRLTDASGRNFVRNGDFEDGTLDGWSAAIAPQSQNLTSGPRALPVRDAGGMTRGSLSVRRSFFALPGRAWGRWVDLFINPGDAPVTADVVYRSRLASAGYAPTLVQTVASRALSAWDAGGTGRDLGIVFGTDEVHLGTSAGAPPDVYLAHTMTVPAHGRVALVHFVVLDGETTAQAQPSSPPTAPRATTIEEECARIVGDFWSTSTYRDRMAADELDAIANF